MLDFLMIATKSTRKGAIEIYPKFIVKKTKDLMIRGRDFYAIWIEEKGIWSTDEQDALILIDNELRKYYEENKSKFDGSVRVLYMWDSETGMIDRWHKYCQKHMRDSFHMLDETLVFSNAPIKKEYYASKRLNYPLEEGNITHYDKLMNVLYSDKERHKIEWAIGSIVNGESKKLQKFLVLYGSAGTGKSTILNIIQMLFDGYYSVFDAKALGSTNGTFALESFRSNPLVAIQHDGDLSKIEDNTRLNSLISHEYMTVNEKFKSTYQARFKCFLFMGTNKPVKITDAKSGIIRRLIDVKPSGDTLSSKKYNECMKNIPFELGAIAYHCKTIFEQNPHAYDKYIPVEMFGATNDFYNFVFDSYYTFKNEPGVSLKVAWAMYNEYCEETKVPYPYSQRIFKEELKNYFNTLTERKTLDDGTRVRNYFEGFKYEKFDNSNEEEKINEEPTIFNITNFKEQESIFDKECMDCLAQYASVKETPMKAWSNVKTKLKDIDTSKLHYVKVPENHIVIDFDIPDENGNKNLDLNILEANGWPETYGELSKSGKGIHLHYIYKGDVNDLNRIFKEHVEIKIFTGGSSLRRKHTKNNGLDISTISSGLPMKGEKNKVISRKTIRDQEGLMRMIKRNLNKEIHSNTSQSINFIYDILEDAYNSGMQYDVSKMRNAVVQFAASSTNQSERCLKLVNEMKFKSKDPIEWVDSEDDTLVFFDVEVFPNLFLVNYKRLDDPKVSRMINPSPQDIEVLLKYRLIGFNCRRYDNHILYGRLIGYSNEQLYDLSQRIISGSKNAFFREAWDISYTDVYDFCSEKKSLKKWEIELKIHHKELGLPWDKPVPEEMWVKVAEYCDNDVIATEAVFKHRKADFVAREVLAEVVNASVNTPTNTLTTRMIFGNDRSPQSQFNYRDMGEVSNEDIIYSEEYDEYTRFNKDNQPVFPGYEYDFGKSTYRGEVVGEGGYVYSTPGMYGNVALLDVTSMHPSSIVNETLFGGRYTARFKELLDARIAIKRKDFSKAKKMLGGSLAKYLVDEKSAGELAQALKIAINSVYGLTSAKFDNPFRDIRNKDNIVAKRGALFMINLKHEVEKKGFIVAHIKTDSIKIPDATPEIIDFVINYGKLYGYNFEHEATYEKMCLVNDAVYIAKYATVKSCIELYGFDYVMLEDDICKKNKKKEGKWTATGKQFAIPYLFKTLFSKDKILFDDMCETFQVTKGDLYLDMNENLPDVAKLEKELEKKVKEAKKNGIDLDISGNSGNIEVDELVNEINEGHDYAFVGRVGRFCPIKKDCGGGELFRVANGKAYSAPGSKGYRWLESEMIEKMDYENIIDKEFYNDLVSEAANDISSYGDLEWFISEDPYISPPFKDGVPVYITNG